MKVKKKLKRYLKLIQLTQILSTHYWENGIHLWDTGYDMDEEYEKMLKPPDDKYIYVGSFSKKQG